MSENHKKRQNLNKIRPVRRKIQNSLQYKSMEKYLQHSLFFSQTHIQKNPAIGEI